MRSTSRNAFVIDVGSASVRLIGAVMDSEGNVTYDLNKGVVTNLRRALDQENVIDWARSGRTFDAVRSMMALVGRRLPCPGACICTQAIRQASNSNEFLARLEQITGFKPELLSSCREGELAWRGSGHLLKTDDVLIDLGGGSTELIRLEDTGGLHVQSFPVGAGVELVDSSESSRDMKPAEMIQCAGNRWNRLIKDPRPWRSHRAIILGGTVVNLASFFYGIEQFTPGCMHGKRMRVDELKTVTESLMLMPLHQRADLRSLEEGRESIIVNGSAYLVSLCELLKTEEIVVSEYGIRYGRLHELLQADF